MSDHNSIQQKIKRFSKFITTKVKEKTQNVFSEEDEEEEDMEEGKVITRRHSSYVRRTSIEDSIFINTIPFNIKEDVYHYHTISSATTNTYNAIMTPSSPTTPVSALSPPPRQPKLRGTTTHQRKSITTTSLPPSQPCLSRSNTLGDYSNQAPDTPPIPFVSPSTPS